MTSIIKVDQIQNTAGAAPTAADLGLNVSGAILDHHYMKHGVQTSVVSSSGFVNSGLTLTVTPKSASSKFIISYNVFFYFPNMTSTWSACYGRILKDGTAIRTDEYTLGRGAFMSVAAMVNTGDTFVNQPNTTSPVTYSVQFAGYTGTIYMHQGNQEGFLSIYEMAG